MKYPSQTMKDCEAIKRKQVQGTQIQGSGPGNAAFQL